MADNSFYQASVTPRRPSISSGELSLSTFHENPRWRVGCGLILASLLFERFSFYAIVGNFVYVLTSHPFSWSANNALFAVFILLVAAYFTPVFAGILSDTLLGKFWVIVIGYGLYLAYMIFPMMFYEKSIHWFVGRNCSTFNASHMWQECGAAYVMSGLVIVGIGAGFIRSVMAPFGAEQVSDATTGSSETSDRTRRYFLIYYWMNNVGAGFAFTGFAYLQQVYLAYSYAGAFASIIISFCLFIIGKFYYVVRRTDESHIKHILGVVKNSLDSKLGSCNARQTVHGFCNSSTLSMSNENEHLMEARFHRSDNFLDRAMWRHGGKYEETTVEKVKIFFRIIVVFCSIFIFWVIYFQMQTTFLIQGLNMDVTLLNFMQVPPAWLSMFDLVAVIVCIPFIGLVIFPLLKRLKFAMTPRCQILVGMLFATLSMLSAGLVEHYRLVSFWGNGTTVPVNYEYQIIGHAYDGSDDKYAVSKLTIFWQIPQYTLMGCSEALISVAVLHFIFQRSPSEYLSLLNGCFWLCMALGGLLGGLIIQLCDGLVFLPGKKYGPVNYRVCDHMGCESRLAIYFFALAGFQVIGMIIFSVITWFMAQEPPAAEERVPSAEVVICSHYDVNSMEPPVIG